MGGADIAAHQRLELVELLTAGDRAGDGPARHRLAHHQRAPEAGMAGRGDAVERVGQQAQAIRAVGGQADRGLHQRQRGAVPEDPAGQQGVEEGRHVGRRGDDAAAAEQVHRRIPVVGVVALEELVRTRASTRRFRAFPPGVGQAAGAQCELRAHRLRQRLSADALDDRAEQDVAGVGVRILLAGFADRLRPLDQVRDIPRRRPFRRRIGLDRGDELRRLRVVGQARGMAEQLPHGHLAGVVTIAPEQIDPLRGQVLVDGRLQVELAGFVQAQRGGGDIGLGHAGDAETFIAFQRCCRRGGQHARVTATTGRKRRHDDLSFQRAGIERRQRLREAGIGRGCCQCDGVKKRGNANPGQGHRGQHWLWSPPSWRAFVAADHGIGHVSSTAGATRCRIRGPYTWTSHR